MEIKQLPSSSRKNNEIDNYFLNNVNSVTDHALELSQGLSEVFSESSGNMPGKLILSSQNPY